MLDLGEPPSEEPQQALLCNGWILVRVKVAALPAMLRFPVAVSVDNGTAVGEAVGDAASERPVSRGQCDAGERPAAACGSSGGDLLEAGGGAAEPIDLPVGPIDLTCLFFPGRFPASTFE